MQMLMCQGHKSSDLLVDSASVETDSNEYDELGGLLLMLSRHRFVLKPTCPMQAFPVPSLSVHA